MNPKTEKIQISIAITHYKGFGPITLFHSFMFHNRFLNCKLHLKQLLTSVGCKSICFISPKLYDTNKILHTIFIFIAKHLDHYTH